MSRKPKPARGVGTFYSAFKRHLRTNKSRIAPLQVISRLEEYLTKELCYVILSQSHGNIIPITSTGTVSDGRRIDVALLSGDWSPAVDRKTARIQREQMHVTAFVEVKFLRNRHRTGFASAEDEIETTLKDLHRQLGRFAQDLYAKYPVKLSARLKDIYGLVLASHVCRLLESKRREESEREFVKRIYRMSRKIGLRYQDLQSPQLERVYSNERVPVLKTEFRASLYIGLWRRTTPAK